MLSQQMERAQQREDEPWRKRQQWANRILTHMETEYKKDKKVAFETLRAAFTAKCKAHMLSPQEVLMCQ